MKKKISLLFTFVLILCLMVCLVVNVSAAGELASTGKCGDNVYWNYNSTAGELVISGTGEMYNYNSGDYSPFWNSLIVKRVVIEDGVTSVGARSFELCYNIEEIIISNSVTNIGDYSFSSCEKLASITIPYSVTSIGNNPFWGCKSLAGITVDPNNEYYSNDSHGVLFNIDKTQIIAYPIGNTATSYVFPDSITSIGGDLFINCFNLTSVTIPYSVISIDDEAFDNCQNLTNITVDTNNEYYSSDSDGVLFNKDKSKLVKYPIGKTANLYTIPDFVTSIGYGAFRNSKNLKNIIIPDNIVIVEDYAFYSCYNLASITMGNGITYIGSGVFSYSPITSITIPKSVTSIGYIYANFELKSIVVDPNNEYYSNDSYGVLFNKDKSQLITYPVGRTETSYTIPDTVTSIGYGAFGYVNSYLESITIPDSVMNIDVLAFANCMNLKDVYYSGTRKEWNDISIGISNDPLLNANIHCNCEHMDLDENGYCDICGEIFIVDSGECGAEGDNVTWKLYSNGDLIFSGTGAMADNLTLFNKYDIKNVVIEDGVTTIGSWAFSRCDSLTSITIPNSVTSIGDSAFSGCKSLASIVIPNNVTSIGKAAFFGCESLINIWVSNSTNIIDEIAFDGCTNLIDVYFDGSEKKWNTIKIESGNEPLLNANKHFIACSHVEDGYGTIVTEEIIEKLRNAGVNFENRKQVIDMRFSGMTFVLTGALTKFTRDQAAEQIEHFGGKVSGSVSKKTTYVILGENAGSKERKARELGIPILSEDDFLQMMQ